MAANENTIKFYDFIDKIEKNKETQAAKKAEETNKIMKETFKALMGNLGTITQTTINAVIGYFSTIIDVVGIVTRTMQTLFSDAFDNILNVASGFWQSV